MQLDKATIILYATIYLDMLKNYFNERFVEITWAMIKSKTRLLNELEQWTDG